MAVGNLNKLTLPELLEHKKEVEEAISTVRERQIKEARAQMRDVAAKSGLTFEDLFPGGKKKGGKGSRKGYAPSSVLYRNPDDKSAKPWTGRGKRPNWLVAKVSKGAKLEDFKVSA